MRLQLSVYALFNLVVLAGPLLVMVFAPRLRWSKKQVTALVRVYLLVSLPMVALDTLSHWIGWWGYNPAYVWPLRLVGLPVEEIAFFFTVPFACLFVYTALPDSLYGHAVRRSLVRAFALATSLMLAILLGVSMKQRTLLDVALFILASLYVYKRGYSCNAKFIVWTGIVVGLFAVFNTVLTALPIVTYAPEFGSVYRIGTIPLEDFLYNLTLLWASFAVFTRQSNRK